MINACTIVARNYLAHAQVLVDSFRAHHPDGSFVVLIVDDPSPELPRVEGAEVVAVQQIGVPEHDLARMTLVYDLLELSTALKPWLLTFLLDGLGGHVAYFDPDIVIGRRIDELPALASQHSIVLTPHLTEPMPRDGGHPREQTILLKGTYNLGFIAVGDTVVGREMLGWWASRLVTDARVDVERGYFTDQRLMDLVPGLFPCRIVTDPSWNVAYWNLPTRALTEDTDGGVLVNGLPLTFVHFSGYDPDEPHLLSRHQGPRPRVLLSEEPLLRELCDDYGRRLRDADFARHQREFVQPFGAYDGVVLSPLVRRLAVEEIERRERGAASDLAIGSPAGLPLDEWLLSKAPDDIGGLGRLLTAVYAARPDVQAAYPEVERGDTGEFLKWAEVFGQHEHGISAALVDRVRSRRNGPPDGARNQLSRPADPVRSTTGAHGVELAGYLSANLGLGETARQFASSLEVCGVPLSTTTWARTNSFLGTPWHDRLPAPGRRHDTLLMCVNADMTRHLQEEAGRRYLRGRYRIGLWFWELDQLPEELVPALDLVDEVWTCSEFNASAVRARTRKPVTVLPHPVHVAGRNDLRIPELQNRAAFTFLFVFDHFSVLERKNPLGVVAAFKRAFPRVGAARLVIKSVNGASCPIDRERLRHAADRPDIVLIERDLSRHELDALMWASDCYVSLHRSEGFGQTVAEMMAIGKPVITTAFSGTMEFTRPCNSYLVDYELVSVPVGCDPYPVGATWADPSREHAAALMRRVFENPHEAREHGRCAASDIARSFSRAALGGAARARLEEIWASPRFARRTREPGSAEGRAESTSADGVRRGGFRRAV